MILINENVLWDEMLPIDNQSTEAKNWLKNSIMPNIQKVEAQLDGYNRPYAWTMTSSDENYPWKVTLTREYQEGNKSWAMHKNNIIIEAL